MLYVRPDIVGFHVLEELGWQRHGNFDFAVSPTRKAAAAPLDRPMGSGREFVV